ncbi:MAG: plasmid pRiA4b ORF-3 family protein [Anaerolineae bacterium]|nr:plasmid pRiA4b ORF-3 family protein [Anaerolineae bacterium]
MWNRHTLELTEAHRGTLRALRVDEQGPGTVLHDFKALLDFVHGRNLPASKAHQLLPLTALPQINALLSQPIEVRLKRPQLKSYPHLQGLYLLLRATGLGQIVGTPAKPVLAIDPQVHDAWSALNPTEQYFTLLEAWLLRGEPEIVGEHSRRFTGEILQGCAQLISQARGSGLLLADDPQVAWYWLYSPGRMGIALMELFGFLTVAVRPPQEGEGWIVEAAYATPLGEAVLALLQEKVFSDIATIAGLDDTPQPSFGVLQPILAPYVRQWEHSLELSPWAFREGRYVFKAALGRGLWRRIAIDAGEPLAALAGAILDAYEFDHDHLYEFSYRNRFGINESVHHPFVDAGPWTDEVRVGDVPLAVGHSMTFVFDFGDWWQFEVVLEQIDPKAKALPGPAVIDGRGDAPEQYPNWDDEE